MLYDTRYLWLSVALFFASIFPLFLSSQATSQRADILIIAPHPDDAVLCCAGFIQQAITKGQSIHILELTHGEAYTDAAAYLSKKPATSLTTDDYLRLGNARKKEEYRATHILGLSRHNITFLGYPDGLLEEVYNTHDGSPFSSRYTGLSASPETGMPYANAAMTNDIATTITRTKPTLIVVPDTGDTALDHIIARKFVDDAMEHIAYQGQLLTYVIHNDAAPLFANDTPLMRIHLNKLEKRKKLKAITTYRTQHAIEPEYVFSFANNEEIFAQFTQP
jgi:LmbE family N-acetylglucosaminyl deacetylase